MHLVTVAHGTRNVAGNEVARRVTAAAGERLGVAATAAYVELCDPLLEDVMAAATEPAVVVPLLLSTGYHVRVDLPAAVGRASVPVSLGGSFGPDPLLAAAQVARLREAGAEPGRRVVLVAAGSSDPDATADQDRAAQLLAEAWGGDVVVATLSGRGNPVADVVRPDDAVSPYLLSPGFFHDRVRRESPEGAVVADVLGEHPAVVDLVVQRAAAMSVS